MANMADSWRSNEEQQQKQQQRRPLAATVHPQAAASKLEQPSVCNNEDDSTTQLQLSSPLKAAQAKRPFPSSNQENENLVGKTTKEMTQVERLFKRYKSSSSASFPRLSKNDHPKTLYEVAAMTTGNSKNHAVVDEQDDAHWDEYYYQLAFFKATKGHANVPKDYVCKDDYFGKKDMVFQLGNWVHRHRAELSVYLQVENLNKQEEQAVPEHIKLRIQKLQNIGFEFDDDWDAYYVGLVFFKATQEHTNVPLDYVSKHDKNRPLGKWVAQQKRELSAQLQEGKILHTYIQKRIEKLEDIGFDLKGSHGEHQQQQADSHPKEQQQQSRPPSKRKRNLGWEGHYKLLQAYKAKYHNLSIQVKYVTPEGVKLGKWAALQRESYANKLRMETTGQVSKSTKTISQQRVDLLDKIAFPWKVSPGRPRGRRQQRESPTPALAEDGASVV